MSRDNPLLEASDLAVHYGGRAGAPQIAFAGVNLAIPEGDCLCIVGPSGCGKTTLLKAFGGFLAAARGGVLYRGKHLTAPTRDIVMIFQEHNLYPWLNVEGNIGFGPRRLGVPRAERERRVEELLRIVGLEAARRRYPHELSGGMRQRVAIARALATQPAALLLDEPFTALDVTLRRRMQAFLRDLWARTGTTMLMVTHDIEEAILVGQRVAVMGGAPSNVLEILDTSDPALKDRHGAAFGALEARLEQRMGGDDEAAGAASERAPLGLVPEAQVTSTVTAAAPAKG